MKYALDHSLTLLLDIYLKILLFPPDKLVKVSDRLEYQM